jgi:hypothetical protein
MPWLETDPMTERWRFVLEAEGGLFSFAELCRRHGISRKTGYKWLERYDLDRPDGTRRPISPAPFLAARRRFNAFRDDFNHVRPHQALGHRTPASVYQPSTRLLPSKLHTPQYPAHFEVRKVSTNGGIRRSSAWVNVSHLLGAEFIGLEEVHNDIWAVYFGLC